MYLTIKIDKSLKLLVSSVKVMWSLVVCVKQIQLIRFSEFIRDIIRFTLGQKVKTKNYKRAGKPKTLKVCSCKAIWRLVVCAKQIQLLEWRFLLNCRAIFLTF